MGSNSAYVPLTFDVLYHIVDRLFGTDLINFALASRYFHALATPRICHSATCSSLRRLSSLHRYLYLNASDGSPPSMRALLLHDLTIGFEAQATSNFWRTQQVVGTTARLALGILERAENLRRLHLEDVHALLRFEPRLADAFAGLRHLRELTLSPVFASSLGTPALFRTCDLRVLRLVRVSTKNARVRDFLAGLAGFPNLESLTLAMAHAFACPPESDRESEDVPCVPSLRTLRLEDCRLGYFTPSVLARSFPNITELQYIAVEIEPDEDDGTALWGNTLRYVVYHPELDGTRLLATRLGPRERLELVVRSHTLSQGSAQEAYVKNCAEVIASINPVGLTLEVSGLMKGAAWFVARGVTRLRWLELKPVDYAACIDILHRFSSSEPGKDAGDLSVLRSLPLVYASVHIPVCQKTESLARLEVPGIKEGNVTPKAMREAAHEIVLELVRHVRSIRFVACIPMDDGVESPETTTCAMWWRVVEGKDERRLMKIPSWVGQNIQHFLREADGKSMEQFDALCP